MCVSFRPARFTGTTVYAGRAFHPVHGSVHVCGYQNTPQNLSSEPNAMILHFPAVSPMNEGNNIDVSNATHVLDDMVKAVQPVSFGADSLRRGSKSRGVPVHIFDTGIYTVVMSSSPDAIRKALKKVDASRRPKIDKALFDYYKKELKGYSFAVCCFNTADAKKAAPIMFWYEPLFPQYLVAPGLDAHDGLPPKKNAAVDTDHWVLFGSPYLTEDNGGSEVTYRDPDANSKASGLSEFLPKCVIGRRFASKQPNGDFVVAVADVEEGRATVQRRVLK